jgi:hypothetical protein
VKAVKFAESLSPLLVPLDRVQQHKFNPNNGDLEKLIESIKVNGFLTAITADWKTGNIIAGNHRWQALHALGATHIPVIWHDFTTESGTRFLIGDNAVGQAARMDHGLLTSLMNDLRETELGLLGTGYEEAQLDQMMLDMLNDQDKPIDGHGFGAGEAPMGIFQVVVVFNDSEERDEMATAITDRWPDAMVRTVNL